MKHGLAVVVAHPDDDAFGVTGTTAMHADDPEFRLACIIATSGERGMISDPGLASREGLGAVREREDLAGWRALGREPDRLEFWRYPDGGLAAIAFQDLVDRIAEVLREERPQVVITFGPEGVTGHEDHVTIGTATTEAFHRVRREGGRAPLRLLYNALPVSWIEWFNEELIAAGMEAIDPSQPFQPRGVPDETIAVEVDCTSVWRRKRAALDEHRTQANDTGFPPGSEERVLGFEHFVQAWPEREPGAGKLRDVFEQVTPPS